MTELNAIVDVLAITSFVSFFVGYWIGSAEADSASHGEPNEHGARPL